MVAMKYNFKYKVQSTGKKLMDCKIHYFYFIGFIVLLFWIISCKPHKKNGAEIICEGSYCFWKTKEHEDDNHFIYYYFNKYGQWFIYEHIDKNKIQKYYLRDQLWSERWSLYKDSLLILGSDKYNIKSISDSVIVISSYDSIYKLYKIDKKNKTFRMLQNTLNNDI